MTREKLKECLAWVVTVLGAAMISVRNAPEHGMNMAKEAYTVAQDELNHLTGLITSLKDELRFVVSVQVPKTQEQMTGETE
jgi:transcription elongation GreA/GreB family factor